MSLVRYTTILFDADGTLFDFQAAEAHALEETVRDFGYSFEPGMLQRYHQLNRSLWDAYDKGEITKRTLQDTRFSRFLAQEGLQGDGIQWNRIYAKHLGERGDLLEDALPVCRELCRHCRLAIVTNGVSATQHSRFDRSPLLECFERLFISEEMGYQKPQKEFFDAVLAELAPVKSQETLVVGDSLLSDILGANNAGLDACWFNPGGEVNSTQARPTYEIARLPQLLPLVLGTKEEAGPTSALGR